jgi:hypothetical protein
MARWARKVSATFEDMPRRLIDAQDDAANVERNAWLERHGLALVDYFSWLRARRPGAALRPPSRRKMLTSWQRRQLDEQLEREGPPRW